MEGTSASRISALSVVEEIPENSDLSITKLGKVTEPPDCVDRGFTCDGYQNKRLFVDDSEQQNVTKLARVKCLRFTSEQIFSPPLGLL